VEVVEQEEVGTIGGRERRASNAHPSAPSAQLRLKSPVFFLLQRDSFY